MMPIYSGDLLTEAESGDGLLAKPLCPFCSAQWTDDMVKMLYNEDRWGSDSAGDNTSIDWCLDISCSSCKKLIYRKEGHRTW